MERGHFWINNDLDGTKNGPGSYELITAEILYGMPDFPHLIQSYIWQEYDLAPHLPELKRFLTFWEHQLDGPLRRVVVTRVPVIESKYFYHANTLTTIH